MKAIAYIIFFAIITASCNKYLDAKPDITLATPSTVSDLQALLNNTDLLPVAGPSILAVANNDCYLLSPDWNSQGFDSRMCFIWDKDAQDYNDWQIAYKAILVVNTVLDNYDGIIGNAPTSAEKSIKGAALFYRSFTFFNLSQAFCPVYNAQNATLELGLPLKLSSDINETIQRTTIQQTYDQIIGDMKSSLSLLPDSSAYPMQPTKAAVWGTLARIYLSMNDFANAELYADSCLKVRNDLMDYNSLNASNVRNPIASYNKEVIFQYNLSSAAIITPSRAKIDSFLYLQYSENDLRKSIFFTPNTDGSYKFKGSYDGTYYPVSSNYFSGIAVDEIYLIRAEANARVGNTQESIDDLNTLLYTRWKSGTYNPVDASFSLNDLLHTIIDERRKELCFRGLRWSDLRRLNDDPQFSTTLNKSISGTTYTLPPGDKRYTILIPHKVISLNHIQQNPR